MSTHKRLLLGCIADDFTGAGDAASFLQDGGLKTLLVIWPHVERVSPESYDAVVVALKSRSIPPEDAIRESLAALDWLKTQGAQKLYFKYCSTFDSTPRGNIGPVCDAILEHYGIPCTVLCPSLLSNGRSVRGGTLFACGTPRETVTKDNLRSIFEIEADVYRDPVHDCPYFIAQRTTFGTVEQQT